MEVAISDMRDSSPSDLPLQAEPGTPLFVQLRDVLRSAILAGKLAGGERLPSEAALIRQYGVSRVTVRQALSDLQSQGLITTVNGKGSYVTRPDGSTANRSYVGILSSLRREGHQAAGKVLSHRNVKAAEDVARALRVPPGTTVGCIRILRYRDGRPFIIGANYLSVEMAERLAAEDLTVIDVAAALEARLGIRIGDVRMHAKAVAADAKTAKLLDYPLGAPILRVRSTAYSYDREPITYGDALCHGELCDLRFNFSGWRKS